MRLRTIELFAGAGGAAVGLRAAGVEALACVDADEEAVATLNAAGFPGVCARVEALDPSAYAGADLVWASPPCQPYSRAGQRRGEDDPRDAWPATRAFVAGARPRWVAVENVRGAPVDRWARELRDLGYVYAESRELDAADYGVPQRRRRLFVVAGPTRIDWPTPTHHGPALPPLLRMGRQPWRTLGEALGVRAIGGGTNPRGRDLTDEPSTTIPAQPGGNACPIIVDEWRDRPSPAVTTCEVRGTRGAAMFAATRSGAQRGGPDRAADALWLATGRRRPTIDEVAILQAFPAGYPFRGTVAARYRQVGNAVPPPLAEMIARAILEAENHGCARATHALRGSGGQRP